MNEGFIATSHSDPRYGTKKYSRNRVFAVQMLKNDAIPGSGDLKMET